MSNLLNRLAARTLGLMPSLQPKLTSRYESGQTVGDGMMSASIPAGVIESSATAANIDAPQELLRDRVGSNSIDLRSQNLPTPLVSPQQPSLAMTRFSHASSNSILSTAPDRLTELNSAVASIDQNAPDIPAITTDLSQSQSLERKNLDSNPPLIQPPILPQESITTRSNQSPSDPFNSSINRSEGQQTSHLSPELPTHASLQPPNPVNLAASIRANTPQSHRSSNGLPSVPAIDLSKLDPLANPARDLDPPSIVVPVATNPPLNQALSANDHIPDQTMRSLVPIVPRPTERKENSPDKGFQHRQNPTPSAPTIQVKIGRIEIRAVTSPAPPPRSRPSPSAPQISLADYLKSRGGG
jgi:hypothetical protein